jgi:8-hydroxy-5-deazaflavin:NADPH oxidoreductase
MNISFIGAGHVATNLGNLFSQAGHSVTYGTRNPKGNQVTITQAIKQSEIVCFAIPFSAMASVLTENQTALKRKIVVDITNAINLSDWSPLYLGEDSGGEQVQRLVPESKVVKAFNAIFADVMLNHKQVFEGNKLTAFVASDDTHSATIVKQLADDAGFNGFIVGSIKNARYLETMAHLNIAIASVGGTDAGFTYFQR